jgi:hypothetical protein
MKKDFLKITSVYTVGIILTYSLIWFVLQLILPDSNLNFFNVIFTALGLNIPIDFIDNAGNGIKTISVVVIISILSLGLILLNVYFGAIVTAHFIRPKIDLKTSSFGVLSTKWNIEKAHILVRMSNFHDASLVNVRINIVLSVQETRNDGTKSEDFITFLPISNFTPPHILVMEPKMPWSIAIPTDTHLSNSLTKDYHFNPGEPIKNSFSKGKNLESVKRKIEILIEGIDSKSFANFIVHRKIEVDAQSENNYTLQLYRGVFKSLPLHIDSSKDLEEVEID